MQIYTYFAVALALGSSAFAAPISSEHLEKRLTRSGRGTFFTPGLGACGKVNNEGDHIVAISSKLFGKGQNCEQFVELTNTKTKKKAFGLVRDACPGCAAGDIDMSPALFKTLGASLDEGVINISWHFKPKGFNP